MFVEVAVDGGRRRFERNAREEEEREKVGKEQRDGQDLGRGL